MSDGGVWVNRGTSIEESSVCVWDIHAAWFIDFVHAVYAATGNRKYI